VAAQISEGQRSKMFARPTQNGKLLPTNS
jgi:hypothetical protein